MARNSLYHVGSGFGTEMKKGTTVREGMALAGIDREVVKRPIMGVLNEDEAIPFESKAMTLEMPSDPAGDPIPLGIVGADYSICQNENAMAVAIELERRGKFQLQSVARMKNGGRVMLTGKVADHSITRLDGSPDELLSQFVFSNAHTGQGSVIMGFTHIRKNCNNQNVAIMRGLKHEVRLQHAGDLDSRVAEAQAMLLKGEDELAKAREVFQGLATTRMTKAAYRKFAAGLLNAVKGSHEEGDGVKDARETEDARAKTIKELEDLFLHGIGNTGETAWDAFNSVTEWLDHKVDRMKEASRTQDRYLANAESANFGRNKSIKGRALRMLVK